MVKNKRQKDKLFLKCVRCGYVQAVKSAEMWGCSVCKKLQLVNKRAAKKTNQSGKVLRTCRYCGHIQAVGGEVWMCYKCKKAQPSK